MFLRGHSTDTLCAPQKLQRTCHGVVAQGAVHLSRTRADKHDEELARVERRARRVGAPAREDVDHYRDAHTDDWLAYDINIRDPKERYLSLFHIR